MAKNRRYSKYSSSRSRSERKENRLLTGITLVGGVLLAALCGRTLDARYTAAFSPGSSQGGDEPTRAALRLDTQAQGGVSYAIKEVERLSGVVGAPPLPLEEWSTETPILMGEVDVSGLLAQEFTLKRSTANGYAPKSIRIGGNFARQGTYFDLLVKDEKGAAQIVRIEEGHLAVVYRAPSGIESERLRVPFTSKVTPTGEGCSSVTLEHALGEGQLEPTQIIKCHSTKDGISNESVLSVVPNLPVKGRIVSVSTNLVKSELSELTITGEVRGVKVEDKV